MRNILSRIRRLENECKKNIEAFRLEDGSLFYTDSEPIGYLLRNGVYTPRGRIVEYILNDNIEEYDPISRALIGYISQLIERRVEGQHD